MVDEIDICNTQAFKNCNFQEIFLDWIGLFSEVTSVVPMD